MTWPISLYTACAPWEALSALAARAAAAGIGGLDLACKPHRFDASKPAQFWDNNAAVLDLDALEDLAPAAAVVLAQHGLRCPVLAGYADADDLATARRLARAAGQLGAALVRLTVPAPRAGLGAQQLAGQRAILRGAADVAAEMDIRFVVELHPGTLACSASSALRILDGLDAGHVGVILDVANLVCEGNEPLPLVLDWLGPYVAHVHIKDVTVTGGSAGGSGGGGDCGCWSAVATSFAPLGRGVVRWAECLRCLRRAGYAGWLAIENYTGVEIGPRRIVGDMRWLAGQIAESEHE